MTDLRKAAEMALEALEGALSDDKPYIKKSVEAIGFLRTALAQPEKEPMSFQTWRSRQHGDPEEIGFLQALKHAYESGQYSVSPPRKEWVGLTDKEMYKLWVATPAETEDRFAFARAIEAKLKERNYD